MTREDIEKAALEYFATRGTHFIVEFTIQQVNAALEEYRKKVSAVLLTAEQELHDAAETLKIKE